MFPDAVATTVAYLDSRAVAAGDSVRAHGRVPTTRPARFVRVMQTGSSRRSMAHRDVQLTVECWAPSEPDAERLGDLVHGWLCDMDTPEGHVPQGERGWLGGPYSQEDPLSGSPRHVMTCIVRQRVT